VLGRALQLGELGIAARASAAIGLVDLEQQRLVD